MTVGRKGLMRESLKQLYKEFYSLRDKKVNVYDLPAMTYVITSGASNHNIYEMHEFKEVWTMGRFINRVKHYTIHNLKKNFSRMPLEMEWGTITSDGITTFTARMVVPDYITDDLYVPTLEDLQKRLGIIDFPLDLNVIPERRCGQLLHIGTYDTISDTREKLKKGLREEGHTLQGGIQEIYMNHPHCNPPDKLKILLRQEVE